MATYSLIWSYGVEAKHYVTVCKNKPTCSSTMTYYVSCRRPLLLSKVERLKNTSISILNKLRQLISLDAIIVRRYKPFSVSLMCLGKLCVISMRPVIHIKTTYAQEVRMRTPISSSSTSSPKSRKLSMNYINGNICVHIQREIEEFIVSIQRCTENPLKHM